MALKVLIVDDEALARSRLRTLLGECTEPRADVVGEASNAVQAMEQIQRMNCDLVMLDIHMPGVDGIALASTLRQMAAPPAIVFVTAHAEHAVHAFELEAIDYLTKPVRRERLQQALQKVVRLRSATEGNNNTEMDVGSSTTSSSDRKSNSITEMDSQNVDDDDELKKFLNTLDLGDNENEADQDEHLHDELASMPFYDVEDTKTKVTSKTIEIEMTLPV